MKPITRALALLLSVAACERGQVEAPPPCPDGTAAVLGECIAVCDVTVICPDGQTCVAGACVVCIDPFCPDDCTLFPEDDRDGDGACDDADVCPDLFDADQLDSDGDGVGDVCDPCPLVSDEGPEDRDGDGVLDACDACPDDAVDDVDGDGVCTSLDNCPELANPDQVDLDGDAAGDACDPCVDIDGDGVCAEDDNCPGHANPVQGDHDGDAIGWACDPLVALPPALFDFELGEVNSAALSARGETVAIAVSSLERLPADFEHFVHGAVYGGDRSLTLVLPPDPSSDTGARYPIVGNDGTVFLPYLGQGMWTVYDGVATESHPDDASFGFLEAPDGSTLVRYFSGGFTQLDRWIEGVRSPFLSDKELLLPDLGDDHVRFLSRDTFGGPSDLLILDASGQVTSLYEDYPFVYPAFAVPSDGQRWYCVQEQADDPATLTLISDRVLDSFRSPGNGPCSGFSSAVFLGDEAGRIWTYTRAAGAKDLFARIDTELVPIFPAADWNLTSIQALLDLDDATYTFGLNATDGTYGVYRLDDPEDRTPTTVIESIPQGFSVPFVNAFPDLDRLNAWAYSDVLGGSELDPGRPVVVSIFDGVGRVAEVPTSGWEAPREFSRAVSESQIWYAYRHGGTGAGNDLVDYFSYDLRTGEARRETDSGEALEVTFEGEHPLVSQTVSGETGLYTLDETRTLARLAVTGDKHRSLLFSRELYRRDTVDPDGYHWVGYTLESGDYEIATFRDRVLDPVATGLTGSSSVRTIQDPRGEVWIAYEEDSGWVLGRAERGAVVDRIEGIEEAPAPYDSGRFVRYLEDGRYTVLDLSGEEPEVRLSNLIEALSYQVEVPPGEDPRHGLQIVDSVGRLSFCPFASGLRECTEVPLGDSEPVGRRIAELPDGLAGIVRHAPTGIYYLFKPVP